MEPQGSDLVERLAELRRQLDYPPDVAYGVFQLPILLDPLLDDVEAAATSAQDQLPEAIIGELEALAALLLTGLYGTATDAVPRRVRIVELLRRAQAGALPAIVADDADAFGASLRSMLETDADLRAALGRLYPLAVHATGVAPSARWLADARALLGAATDGERLAGAVRRVLAALVRADVQSRPDILTGALRLANQRFARGMLWLEAATDAPAVDLLDAVGTRMGTSGRSDAVVRDAALANTAAALLGASADPSAVAALASMRLEVTNRNVLKQIDRALATRADRAGISVEELVDASLPSHGLDAGGRRSFEADGASAALEARSDGRVAVLWRGSDGWTPTVPAALDERAPDLIAHVNETAARIEARLAEERVRLERFLGSERSWSTDSWRRRFGDHPIGRIHASSLVWAIVGGDDEVAVLPVDSGWLGADEGPIVAPDTARIRLWHPADGGPTDVAVWRATLAARAVRQSIRQVDRPVFRVDPKSTADSADVRHAGKVVAHSRMRTLLRNRGWAVPALGPWDQGDEATAWRAFDDGLRAELRYQAPERVPTAERVTSARIVALRFLRAEVAPIAAATEGRVVPVAWVPARVFSEAVMDVSLVVAV